MNKQTSYLIIGNGITGITAAEVLRSEDQNCAITIIADDPSPVYYRPALKDFLGNHIPKDLLWARPGNFYQKNHIRFIPGRLAAISPQPHSVQLQNGEQHHYDKLLLANGAHPRQLDCPGTHLAGVSTLRSIADYQEILRKLPNSSHIIICGSGTLALESAETLHTQGYHVTHLLRKKTLWSEILDQTASDMVLQEERRAGIDVRTDETVAEIIGKQGQVTHVTTTNGARIPCDLLLIAIGIVPNIDCIQASGIACGQGVKVDTLMHTNAPDIYAAGDVIETTNPLTGQTRVIGQWFPAIQQARTAAYSMLNNQSEANSPLPSSPPITETFYNATFLYGLDFVAIGVTLPQMSRSSGSTPYQEIVAEPAPRNYRKVLLKNGIPVGALFLGERKQALAFKRAIDARVNLTEILPNLFSDDFQLDAWLDKQRIPETVFESRTATMPVLAAVNPSLNREIALDAYLIPVEHPKVKVATRETRLNATPHTSIIGRQEGVTLFIEHSSISRKHAEIVYKDGDYILQDLKSSNGTFVNTLPLPSSQAHILQPNDKLRFGDVQFQFQLRKRPIQVANPQHDNATLFQHIRGSQLEHNTIRSIPEAILSTARDTPSFILLTKDAKPAVVPIVSEQLTGKQLIMGRDSDNAIVLSDTAASRKHAAIFGAPDGLYIRDLKSSNGIFVNKVRITNPYHLSHGDRIVIGNTLIYCSLPNTLRISSKLRAIRPVPTTPSAPIAITIGHRNNIQPLPEKRIQFEIDMCIGCNRCMAACPLPSSTQMSIATLNQATISPEIASIAERFTHECIMCGSCVPVCPVDNHRDLLMLSLKQRLGSPWDRPNDMQKISATLPSGWSASQLVSRLREQPILSNEQVVPENYLLHLFTHSHLRSLTAGVTLIREGEYGRDLYILLEGRLSISSTETQGKELQVGIIKRGEYTGEYGMLTGQPYPTTIVTLTSALVLQVPEQVVQQLMELVPRTRTFFEQLNNARSIEGVLKRMALFQGISDTDIHALVEQTSVQQYDRDECLFSEDGPVTLQRLSAGPASPRKGRPVRETLHVLLEGFVKVARLKAEAVGHGPEDQRIIAYRQGGDYFAGGLDLLGDGQAVTVTSITRTRVAEVPRSALLTLFKRYPEVGHRFTARLHQYIESTASAQSRVFEESLFSTQPPPQAPADPSIRAGLHSLINNGVIEGTEVLVIDLDKCIHCNECEEACARRHGHSRMNRKGMVVGNISIATACRQCQDPVCLLCSRAGIARRPDGEVYITESCIGCGICAERCPYGAISIVELEDATSSTSIVQRFSTFFSKNEGKEQSRKYLSMANKPKTPDKQVSSGPLNRGGYDEMRKKVAIKCDLCADYNDQACVQACPTGAAIRIHPTTFFGSTEEILHKKTH